MIGIHIFRASFRRNRIYFLNQITSNIGSFIFGYVFVCVWRAVLTNSADQVILSTYTIINQSILWVTVFLPKGCYLPEKVRKGSLVFDLLRPHGILFESFFEVLGSIGYSIIFKTLPIFLMGVIIIGIKLPNIFSLLLFFLSIGNAILISFFLNYFIGLWSIKYIDFSGAQYLYYSLTQIFCGTFIPIEYYPSFLRSSMYYLPFASINYVPAKLFLGELHISYFYIQIFWVIALWLIAIFLTKKLYKTIVLQGG